MTDRCYRIEGPAVISFSGGRSSAYMLAMILHEYGGKLPDDVSVIFANTGKEMGETLDFIERCSDEWNVPITWLEYRPGKQWAVVDYATASRKGEPFEAVITDRNFLPNPVARICTVELKVLTMERYVTTDLGWEHFTNAVGIRGDEPRRLAKIGNSGRAAFTRTAPLGSAKVTALDVSHFWERQSFDLGLPNRGGKTMHGNCDLCFLKGADQVLSLIREQPERAVWWMAQEDRIRSHGQINGDAGKFRSDRPSYAQMHKMATDHGELFEYGDEALQDCMCTD